MREYTIQEQSDGRYVVTSNLGRTIIGYERDCRSTHECYAALAEEWLMGDMSREVTIKFYFSGEQDV